MFSLIAIGVFFLAVVVGTVTPRQELFSFAGSFLLLTFVLFLITWHASYGWSGIWSVASLQFAGSLFVSTVLGLTVGVQWKMLFHTDVEAKDPLSEFVFPMYLMKVGGKQSFYPLEGAGIAYSDSIGGQIEGPVLEADLSVRNITQQERESIATLADAYATQMAVMPQT